MMSVLKMCILREKYNNNEETLKDVSMGDFSKILYRDSESFIVIRNKKKNQNKLLKKEKLENSINGNDNLIKTLFALKTMDNFIK